MALFACHVLSPCGGAERVDDGEHALDVDADGHADRADPEEEGISIWVRGGDQCRIFPHLGQISSQIPHLLSSPAIYILSACTNLPRPRQGIPSKPQTGKRGGELSGFH